MNVSIWQEKVTIPTYEIGDPEKNPIFLENRVYQGSSGKVYPLPIVEKISDVKIDKVWNAVFLENDYLKIMILPELGGRVQMAYDKVKKRHFVYYNQVIKPALVGLTGPWISGGIEFNWPQHHRPSTYSAIDYNLEENTDGSKTIWCSEIEQMTRTKGMMGFTLHPDKSYLEIKAKLYNRTPQPQSFLWWANPAVKVNDDYQSVFPPDVHAVFDHGKRDVSSFPIATGTYYKIDYSPGTDISKYKNIPVPTSYMAVNSDYNFVGGYENDVKGGLLHIANHHVSPGKKQWTWGNGDFGKSWDKHLTDEDGPYIELMCGVYTDNQPDFTWIQPFEEKTFSQYFMPYKDLGVVKNASKDAMLNLKEVADILQISCYTTGVFNNAKIEIKAKDKVVFTETFNAEPSNTYEFQIKKQTNIPTENYYVSLFNAEGTLLISYKGETKTQKPIPEAAKAAKFPEEIKSIEQLFLTGLHLEQYRHATYKAEDYYLEGIKREKGDVRCNNAMGLLLLRRGQFKQAEVYFRTAIATLTDKNPNPYDGEPYYNLGQSLKYQEKYEDAFDAFYKSAWNAAWQDAAYFHLAQIATIKKEYASALELIEKSLLRNWHNHKARSLKIYLLRITNKAAAAKTLIADSVALDSFNGTALFEKYLLESDKNTLVLFEKTLQKNIHNYIEFALDYAASGCYTEAISVLCLGIKNCKTYALAHYYLGWLYVKSGNEEQANLSFNKAAKLTPDYSFAYRLEAIAVLQCATSYQEDAMAYYYLGNLWYDKKQYNKALKCWEKSRAINKDFATVHRNLALVYFNKQKDAAKALTALEKAFTLNTADARVFFELDCLYKILNHPLEKRLQNLQEHSKLLLFRDDLYLEECTTHNSLGNYNKALELLSKRKFHPWEGAEGKVAEQYVISLVALAKEAMEQNQYQKAIQLLEKTKIYPDNLGEGKLAGTQENDIHFWLGCAYQGLKKEEQATEYYKKAKIGLTEPTAAIFYNDQQPDKIFYQGLACLKLNEVKEAKTRFKNLIQYGENHIEDIVKIDYFAVSLPDLLIWEDDLDKLNKIHCLYLIGLGNIGLGNFDKAKKILSMLLDLKNSHTGALIHLKMLSNTNLSTIINTTTAC